MWEAIKTNVIGALISAVIILPFFPLMRGKRGYEMNGYSHFFGLTILLFSACATHAQDEQTRSEALTRDERGRIELSQCAAMCDAQRWERSYWNYRGLQEFWPLYDSYSFLLYHTVREKQSPSYECRTFGF